jgi:hypothetical protein
MTDMFESCCYCDGEGKIPSNAYFAWRKCPEKHKEQYYKDNPVRTCPRCQGQKELFYINGEKDRFNTLLDRWEQETINLSSPQTNHPCFVEANKMKSKEAIGWLLERMEKEITLAMGLLGRWISKKDSPITEDMRGKMQLMTDEWVKWGKEKGFLNDRKTKKNNS